MVPVVDVLMLGTGLAGLIGALLAWDRGLLFVWTAILIIAAGASLRVIRALLRERAFPVGVAQVFLVACVYDIGRAIAIVARAPHRSDRPRAVATVP
jgi:4-amino-4-deoxy-L-arabinose transferase-like glycosyltransferase